MKLIVDIPDEIYNYLINYNVYISGMRSGKSFVDKILYAVANGKPQPTGHWIIHGKLRECSECKVWFPKDMPRNSYCPNCGTDMGGGKR